MSKPVSSINNFNAKIKPRFVHERTVLESKYAVNKMIIKNTKIYNTIRSCIYRHSKHKTFLFCIVKLQYPTTNRGGSEGGVGVN